MSFTTSSFYLIRIKEIVVSKTKPLVYCSIERIIKRQKRLLISGFSETTERFQVYPETIWNLQVHLETTGTSQVHPDTKEPFKVIQRQQGLLKYIQC